MSDGDVLAAVVLAAMPRELRPLARALGLRAGSLGGLPAWTGGGVVAVAVGVGPVRAGAGAARVLDGTTTRLVLITGVAGGVDPGCRVGDLVRPAAVVDVGSGRVLVPTAAGSRKGTLATVARIYLPPSGPDAGPATLPAGTTAVDMESAAIAGVCEERRIPWSVTRAVSDVAGTLTPEIASLLRADGRADVRAAARMILRHPRSLVRLLRLGLDTSRAVRVVTKVVVEELSAVGVDRRSA